MAQTAQAAARQQLSRAEDEGLALALLRDGLVGSGDLMHALSALPRRRGRLLDLLIARGCADEADLLAAAARHFGVACIDPAAPLPEPRLVDTLGAADCLRLGLVPWRQAGGATIVATSRPEDFSRLRPRLERALGPVLMALAPASGVEAALHARRGPRLALAAENRVAKAESARGWSRPENAARLVLAGLLLLTLLWLAPLGLMHALLALVLLSLTLSTALKIAAALAALRPPAAEPEAVPLARLPRVSVIVALYRESGIAPRLIRRLSRLDYPGELLDVILAVEAEDHLTRAALASVVLPPWMRVIAVPPGRVKTKPRALNFALDHCRGSIIGVYDAEDAPAPDQIRKIVARFHARGPEVACLQGILDYYNPHTNWLSRCFTIEYAGWFRLLLTGIARLGLAVPLGGTTLFFRRSVLEELVGWDAHNVTEDADLGIRLARHGYRTELVDTVTGEEANCRVIPWIKQRSRWIKGFMMTWAVHMRQPRLLWRQLGPWKFAGFQVMFLGSLLQSLLAPLMWSFWVLAFGLWHPLAAGMPQPVFWGMIALFLMSEAANITFGLVALRRSGHRLSPLWVLTMQLYFPLATLAAYKALWEMLRRPYYWDKTHHGLHNPSAPRR